MMTTIKHIIILLGSLLGIASMQAQTVPIPDAAFLAYLKTVSGLVDNKNQLIIAKANSFADSLNLKSLGIQNLDGVQYFINLKGLIAPDNRLSTLPSLGKLAQLQTLNVRNNQLISLPNLDSLGNLSNLFADNNKLSTLPVLEGNPKLLSLQVSNNQISSLPSLSKQTKINILDVSNNLLSSLPNLSTTTSLERLYCSGNQITSLPSLAALPNLKRLDVSKNKIVTLPSLAQNTLLSELVADSNALTSAPSLNGLMNLRKIQLQNNYLTYDDFAPYLGRADSAYLDYSPQQYKNSSTKVSINEGEPVTLTPNNTDTLKGLNYAWYKNGTFIFRSTTKNFSISAAIPDDAGIFYCKITHPRLPKMTLVSDTTILEVVTDPTDPTGPRCPKLPKNVGVKIKNAQCTELGNFELSFADKILDSIKLIVYDSQNVVIPGISTTLYTGIKQGEYRIYMTPKNNGCVYAQEQKIVVKSDKCTEIVLTPNNDGKDDTLYFSQKGIATIFDKNGKTVKTLLIPTEWDGSNSEGILPQGYYLVKINNGNEYFNLSVIY